MIFKKNKYGFYLQQLPADEYYYNLMEEALLQEDENFPIPVESKLPSHTGGYEEFKGKVDNLRNKALDAAGLEKGNVIGSILNKLKAMLVWVKDKITNGIETVVNGIRKIKSLSPKLRQLADKMCNYIMDAIDYIQREFS